MVDREAWADEVGAAAVTAAEAGFPDEADLIISHAAHHGLRPFELFAAGSRRAPVTEPEPAQEGTPMLVTYIGPADKVDLAPSHGGARFVRDQPTEVPDELGRALCLQAVFVPARRRRRRSETPDPALPAAETPPPGETPEPAVSEIPESPTTDEIR